MSNFLVKFVPASINDRSEKLAFLSLAGCISLGLISIAASQILLAVALIGYLWMLRNHKGSLPPGLKIVIPLLTFMVWNVIAALASPNVMLGLTITKKFFLFLLVIMVPLIVRGAGRLTWIYKAIFIVAVISSLGGLVQYLANPHRDLLHRITGFMGQWMTYSGLLMLVLMVLVAYVLCTGVRGQLWVIPAAGFIVLALIFSLTRNAWAGAIAGLIFLILLRRPRAIPVLIAAMLIFFLLSPAFIKQRLYSALDTQDVTTRTRIECFWTSIRIIHDHPWLGVGPKNVKFEALKYRREHEFPDWVYQHMHNNFLQIAAETGIPGLILWVWFMVRLAWDALSCYRHAKAKNSADNEFGKEALVASSAALAAWIALIIAGMFEFNFGDSEVLTFFLFVASAPYAFMVPRSRIPSSQAVV